MSRDLTQRLTALSRAHDLVRPVLSEPKKAAPLADAAVLLAPYDDEAGDRVRISVPELLVGEASATTLALIVHELATNSIKYGALSMATGTIDVSCTEHDSEVVIIWTNGAVQPLLPLEDPQLSGASWSPGASPASSAAPSRSTGQPRASSSRCV